MTEEITTINFDKPEFELVPLLWLAMYGNTRLTTGQLRAHNRVLNKLEEILDVGFDHKPAEQVLQMTQKTAVLAIYRVDAEVPKESESAGLELVKGEQDHVKFILKNMQWPPALSRLAEKLLDKFDIST